MRGVNFTAYQKRKALKLWLEEKMPTQKVCMKCKCTERSLWRWKALYDGTLESLEPQSCRPKTPHPNSHTKEEVEQIEKLVKKKPFLSYNEMYGIMRQKHAYSRTYCGFYRYIVKNKLRPQKELEKYVPKKYDTPEMLGYKWQMDVKYVPVTCYKGEVIHYDDNKFYQYTMIDEATRERFLFPYKEHNVSSTLDFVKRAIVYFGYAPERIQTDNGAEFTNIKKPGQKDPKKHALDIMLEKLGIRHQLIRAYTPRLNGKVERSHRSDQESFYNYLKFKTLPELKKKMMQWNIRYNNRPHSACTNREGKHVWWSPLEKRADLLLLLEEKKEEYSVKFVKKSKQQTIRQVYAA
ncbi:MAG: DDE-type integrase/transposase/recombinase [Candidatus Gastranaerophilales bacterium]|nr:DDE-type integrase/transposase/recombinase [Candidatus Gastranaerophilales bacterium]MBQ7881028.1 DDE-type integrase/transposase/recombinase [Clostridia bacterium]